MEKEEILIVNNEGGKGNPNHKPAGSPDGGQFTSGPESGGGSVKDKFLAFLKSKTPQVSTAPVEEPIVTASTYSFNDIIANNLKGNLKPSSIEKSFLAGTPKAQQIVCDFFRDSKVRIDRGSAKYSPLYGTVYFENSDLTNEGKHGGFYESGETFFHEVFHGIDHKYGELTISRVLSNGKTLQKTFHDEINTNKYSWSMNLFNEVKADFEKAVEEEMKKMFSPEQTQEYKEKAEYYEKALNDLNKNFDNSAWHYQSIQAYNEAYENYRKQFKELKKEWKKYNDITLEARQKATHKYSCLSDFCSFIYRTGLKQSICGGHPKSYWSQDGGNKAIKEMWAELGSMWARGKSEGIERMRKYFPETVSSFEELVGNLDNIRKEKYGK